MPHLVTNTPDPLACCTLCGETTWVLDGSIDCEHDCAAAGSPCEVTTCDLCHGSLIMERGHSRHSACSRWCGCYPCERCERTGLIATPIAGPPMPLDMEHPVNCQPWKGAA